VHRITLAESMQRWEFALLIRPAAYANSRGARGRIILSDASVVARDNESVDVG
jgi:hypothetical protein